MNYELAKELKEAGYPQGGDGQWDGGPGTIATQETMAYIPTLEELIEACERDWRQMGALTVEHSQLGDEWVASAYHNPIHARGKTATEAVARLWLALNRREGKDKEV